MSFGPLPDDTDELVFKALQTYSSGEVVSWIDETPEGGAEPEHPAPVVHLVAATGDDHGHDPSTDATSTTVAGTTGEDGNDGESAGGVTVQEIAKVNDDADSAKSLANVGIVLGAVAALLALAALIRGRRHPTAE